MTQVLSCSLTFHSYYIYESLHTDKPVYIKLRPAFSSLWARRLARVALPLLIPAGCFESVLLELRVCSCLPAHHLPRGSPNRLLQTRISGHITHIAALRGLSRPQCNPKLLNVAPKALGDLCNLLVLFCSWSSSSASEKG